MAFRLRGVPHLQLRRAATIALHDCLSAIFHMQQQQQRNGSSERLLAAEYSFGTLEYARNIGQMAMAVVGNEPSDMTACTSQVAEVVNWAMGAIKEEADEHCRVYQYEIVKDAVQHFEAV